MKKNYTRFCSLALALCMSAATWAIDKVGGVYQIGTVNDLKEFAAIVNTGQNIKANGVLTADINLGNEEVHIGQTASNCFRGYFDGKGHTVTVNYQPKVPKDYGTAALFGFLYHGGVICNVITKGTIETSIERCAGIVSRIDGGMVHNCASFVEIKSKFDSGATHGGIAAILDHGAVWDCFSKVKFTGEAFECGGIIGWTQGENQRNLVRNNLSLAVYQNAKNCGAIARNSGWIIEGEKNGKYLQNFYLNAVSDNGKAQQVTEEKLASGEVCYRLNAGMKTPQWFQKEGDPYPLPIQYEGATTVGASIAANCMVTDLPSDATFTFGGGIASTQHEMFHGRCKECGFLPLEEMEFGLSGTGFVLRNKEDVRCYDWYRYYLEVSVHPVNAIMVADIDMGDDPYFVNPVTPMYGEFNGNGHKLKINISDASLVGKESEWAYTSELKNGFRLQPFQKGNCALFFNFMSYAQVHDLYVTGHIMNTGSHDDSNHRYGATVAQLANDCVGGRVYNLYSDVEIESTRPDDNTNGGIFGKVNGGCRDMIMENVVFAGTFNCTNGGVNCGGLLGWLTGTITIRNAVVAAKFILGNNGDGSNYFSRRDVGLTMTNVWYDPTGNPEQIAKPATATNVVGSGFAVADGSLTYKLNNNRVENVAWTQTLGEGGDKCPIPLKTHGRVNHISPVGYATQFIPSTDVEIPAGVEAYAVTVADSKITLNPITDKISKEDAVVLKGNEGYYSFAPTTGATKAASNDLKGAATDLTAAQMQAANTGCNKFYALSLNKENELNSVGFYYDKDDGSAFAIEAGKGYLALPASAKPISGFRFSDGGTTGIETLKQQTFDGAIYNLQGQRVNANAKGIVIVNGKKVIK